MVKGEFMSSKDPAAVSTTPNSSAAASSAALAPTRVQVRNYMSNGQLCYSWKRRGVDDYGYAREWTSTKDVQDNPVLLHKAKNLASALPEQI